MRLGRISKVVATAVAAALALAACTGTPTPNESSSGQTVTPGGNITVLEAAPFSSFNPSSVTGSTLTNTRISSVTHMGFNTVDAELKVVPNKKFGSYEMVKDKPLTVKYTINDDVRWSDGAPVSADDLFLQWAALSGYFNDATLNDKFAVTSGNAYFHAAGDNSGLAKTELPVISADRKTLTLTYTTPFSDWETALGTSVDVPAHIVASRAGLADAQALTELMAELPQGRPADPAPADPELRKIADFWNTGFDTTSMPDPSLALSNGPYLVKGMTAEKELLLTRNMDFTWGEAPKLDTVTVHYESDPQKQVQALQKQEADIISPAPTAELLTALEALQNDGINLQQGQGLGFDQMVLNFKGVLAEADLRTAFLYTVPRQQIVDEVAVPQDPKAEVLNSFLFRPEQTPYKEAVGSNGSSKFPADNAKSADPGKTSLDKAKELLANARPTVRILYNKDDADRVTEYSLIAAAAAEAGFTVTDAGRPADQWQSALRDGAFDVALYGWSANATGSAQVPQIFKTGAVSNLNNFSNPVVDQLAEELAGNPDDAKQNALKLQIDKLVFEAGYGLPLFQRTTLSATGKNVSGVAASPLDLGPWQSVALWSYSG